MAPDRATPLLRVAAAALLLAAAPRAGATITLPTSCPANNARNCYAGVCPWTEPVLSHSVYDDIALEDLDGINLTEVNVGVCFTLSFTCNAALEVLFNVPELRADVYEIVTPECSAHTGNSSNATFIVNNQTFSDFGAFSSEDCTSLLGLFTATAASPEAHDLVQSSFHAFTVCSDADNCNKPPSSGAAPRVLAWRGAAAAVVALVLSILLL
jgi:hypothetical protein